MQELIGTQEASKLLNKTDSTIRRWCMNGKLKALKVGHDWVIKREDITPLLDQNSDQQEDQPS